MLNKGQQKVDALVKEGKNVALLAEAGTGKSFLINHIKDSSTILAAPTGIAALNIGGMTLHSLFSLPIGVVLDSDKMKRAKKAEELFQSNNINRLIIDEVSMVRSDHFTLIDHRLRKITKKDVPFGGIQVILVGDVGQISPVVAKGEEKTFYKNYKSPWFFKSPAFERGDFQTCTLTEIVRQSDEKQKRMLGSIRKRDNHWVKAVDRINEISSTAPLDAVWLCSFNNQAEKINKSRYQEVEGEERKYLASNTGFKWNEHPVDVDMRLKVGTKVIIKANAVDGSFQNGTQGVVVDMEDKGVWVEKEDGDIVLVERFEWEKIEYRLGLSGVERVPVAKFKQFPLKKGWAVSVHASQGMTLSSANIDFGRGCFASGQCYVALSRVKDLTKMYIQNGLNYSDVIVDDEVMTFYKTLEESQ